MCPPRVEGELPGKPPRAPPRVKPLERMGEVGDMLCSKRQLSPLRQPLGPLKKAQGAMGGDER